MLGQSSVSPVQAHEVDAQAVARAQETLRLRLSRDFLLSQNHNYVLPSVGLSLGVATLVTGAVLFIRSWKQETSSHSGYFCSGEGGSCGTQSVVYGDSPAGDPMRNAGIATLSVGAGLSLVSAAMLVVRVARHVRLKRIQQKLAWLETRASLAPKLAPRGQAGLTVSFKF